MQFRDNSHFARTLIASVLASCFAAAPLAAQVSVQGNTVREREAERGERYSGRFTIVNASDEPQQAKLYQTDYLTSADGSNAYGSPGSTPRSNATWVSDIPSSIVVPPHASREVTFTVSVPADPALSGSYWSMLMVEGVPRSSAESTLPAGPGRRVQAAVVTRIRYAVQLITHVGPKLKPVARFDQPAIHAVANGGKELQLDVVNDGIQSFAPSLTLEVYASDGTRVKSVSARREVLYPGTSLRQHFALGALPAGQYHALVTLDAGDDAVFGAQYTLNF